VHRTTSVGSDEIDRILPPKNARKKSLNDRFVQIEKERPKPIPMAPASRRRYRFAPEGRATSRARQRREARAIEGSYLHRGRAATSRRRRTF